jgi:hypothetical protein
MDSKLKKVVAGVALAGALTVGTAGVASAADGGGPGATVDPTGQVSRHPLLRLRIRHGAVKVVTDTLGVSRQELRDALKGGQTLRQYAASMGKEQAVIDNLTNAATTKLDQLVANGRIKQERADTIKSKLPDRVNKLMDHQFGQHAQA